MRKWIVAAALAVAAAAGGCDREGDWREGLSQDRRPIVDGVREPGEDAVVLLEHDWGFGCTGTAIAPRVVLTAKHCVQWGGASGWHVKVGRSRSYVLDEYRVQETRTTPGSSIEERDIAVMILTEDFAFPLKRWEFLPWPGFRAGATIEAIGYGKTDPADAYSSGTKYRRGGRTLAPRPALQRL